MNTAPRLFMYTKDIMRITGKSERSAYRIKKLIKNKYQKQMTDDISVREFCEHMKLEEEVVLSMMS